MKSGEFIILNQWKLRLGIENGIETENDLLSLFNGKLGLKLGWMMDSRTESMENPRRCPTEIWRFHPKIGGFQAKEMWNFTNVGLMLVVLVVLVGIDPDSQLVCRNPTLGVSLWGNPEIWWNMWIQPIQPVLFFVKQLSNSCGFRRGTFGLINPIWDVIRPTSTDGDLRPK